MARSRRSTNGTFTIGGSERTFPTMGVALSFAQNLAVRAEEPRSWGIYDNGTQIARVVREEDGAVVTTPVAR